MPPKKIIIDTDPGVDDVLALLLAFSASPEELQIPLVSLCFGNVDVQSCLKNVASLFNVIELERRWRIETGAEPGFTALDDCRPVVAIGANSPIEGQTLEHDYFHGEDGLQGVHRAVPHFTPTEMWRHLFTPSDSPDESRLAHLPPNFKPSAIPSHKEILSILRDSDPDTVTIVALGPLTNLALAAHDDPETFLRAKEVVVMGGALKIEGNVTPVAEFNHYACAYSAARIYALTSLSPASTMPPCRELGPYPPLSKRLNLTTVPLDISTYHHLSFPTFDRFTRSLANRGSPLSQWVRHFVSATFKHIAEVYEGNCELDALFSLHDPLCVWYVLTSDSGGWRCQEEVDVRIEVEGQWTRGMCVVDRRNIKVEEDLEKPVKKGDCGVWFHKGMCNRVRVAIDSPDRDAFSAKVLRRIFPNQESE